MRQRRTGSARAIAGAASAAAPMAASTPRLRNEAAPRFMSAASRARKPSAPSTMRRSACAAASGSGRDEDRADDRDAVGTRRDHLRGIRLGDPGDRAERQAPARRSRAMRKRSLEARDADRRINVRLVAGREDAADAAVIDRLFRDRARCAPRSRACAR